MAHCRAWSRNTGLRVAYRPVALSQIFPESGGLPLAKRHPLRQNYRIVELQRWREKRGLHFHLHPQFWPFDPAPGDRIVCAMTLAGVDPAEIHRRRLRRRVRAPDAMSAQPETLAQLLRRIRP